MGFLKPTVIALFLSTFALFEGYVSADTSSTMSVTWGNWLATIAGDNLQLNLTNSSGSGAQSNQAFLFGSIEFHIKLVPGDSAGVVTAYYLSSPGASWDEIDFEFLGNRSGQPWIIHTNVFVAGVGNREQQFYPAFDPTADFHNYTIHWNPSEIVWFVDNTPIRVYRNFPGIPYPNQQGMRCFTSLWNADNWATRGGLEKIVWRNEPFAAEFYGFQPRACTWNGPDSISQCAAPTPENWWTSWQYSQLTQDQIGQMNWARQFMIYDYCKDTNRFNGQMPPECFHQQY